MADNTNRLAGIANITVNGQAYALVGEFSYRVSTVTRETLTGQDAVHGYREMPLAGQIKATIRDAKDLSVAAFNAMTNVTVVCSLANGKTVVGRQMWTADSQDVKTSEGSFEVTWEGPDVSEA